jgi:cell fate regulator YaaT (PSP1 superfamily)
MKPLYCEYTIDSSKIIFYYSAEDRVDFRELLKVLTPNFKTRVELMQIGPREAARIVGGIGNCGRVICCKSCLNSFDYVTMKMAKDQNMSLNTNKISGLCGKLMCCIAFEHQLYVEARKELPSVGEMVKTPTCACCKVQSVDYVKKIVMTEETLGATLVKHNAADVQKVVVGNPDVDEEGATLTATSDTEVVEEEVVVQVAQKDNEQKNDANKYHKKIYKPYKKYKKKASKETVNK